MCLCTHRKKMRKINIKMLIVIPSSRNNHRLSFLNLCFLTFSKFSTVNMYYYYKRKKDMSLKRTGLKWAGRFFSINKVQYCEFSLPYNLLNNIFFSLDLLYCKDTIYNMCIKYVLNNCYW